MRLGKWFIGQILAFSRDETTYAISSIVEFSPMAQP
jgi:hypothetical protein